MSNLPHPRRILIVGGGPVGLVTLRNFLERAEFEHVELVERRDDIGGVWYLDSPNDGARWPSPAYPGLMGNVLPKFLSFSQYPPFPAPATSPEQPFPSLAETQAYLKGFAQPLLEKGNIRLNTEVIRVEELPSGGGWKVGLRDWKEGGKEREENWDAVIVATAWYDNPNWPDTPGLDEVRKADLATHAKVWDGPNGYKGKRVAVIGNANSGNDIASQLAPYASDPGVLRCIRRPNMHYFPMLPHPRLIDVAPVAKYVLNDTAGNGKSVLLELEDGKKYEVDHVFLGTGYAQGVPFIHVLDSSKSLKPLCDPTLKPNRVPSLHRHILYAYNPTLAFIGRVVSATPFVLGDLASTWLALAWSSTTSNPSITYPENVDDRLETERARLQAISDIRESIDNPTSLIAFHILGPEELPYARALREEVLGVRPEYGGEGGLMEWSDGMWDEKEGMFGIKAGVYKKMAEEAGWAVDVSGKGLEVV